jgi:micrococcal nuclease
MDYVYKAFVVGVYDGDTITVDIDLGMNTWKKNVKLRLARIDTPEIRGEERARGIDVRDYVRLLVLNKEIEIQTLKDKTGKYGRYLVEVFIGEINLNDHLLEQGMATEYS